MPDNGQDNESYRLNSHTNRIIQDNGQDNVTPCEEEEEAKSKASAASSDKLGVKPLAPPPAVIPLVLHTNQEQGRMNIGKAWYLPTSFGQIAI